MNEEEFNEKFEKLREILLKDQNMYCNIMTEIFTKGIEEQQLFLGSLKIFEVSEKDKKKNLKVNLNRIISFITNSIKKGTDLYQLSSCVYGAFLGDVIGSFCEFLDSSQNNYKRIFIEEPVCGQMKGQPTDDSEMSMSFAYGVIDNPEKETIDPNYLYFFYGAWKVSDPCDIGKTTENAFSTFSFEEFLPEKHNFSKVEKSIEKMNNGSLANGAIMRKSTFIVWYYNRFYSDIKEAFQGQDNNEALLKLYLDIKKFSHIDNQCTHPNLELDSASSFYCIMALMAIYKLEAKVIVGKIQNLCNFFDKGKNKEIDAYDKKLANFFIKYINEFKSKNFNFWKFFTKKENVIEHMGFYQHSLKLLLYYLLNFDKIEEKNKFREIGHQICNLGGDTDTNACIIMGVLGPLIGMENFGGEFKNMIELIPKKRAIYTVCLMYLYLKFLKETNRNENILKEKFKFLKMIINLCYGKVDITY